MGAISIWHLIILLIIVGIPVVLIFAVVFFTKNSAKETAQTKGDELA